MTAFPHMSEVLPRYATPEEFAELFERHVNTVRRNLREGTLPGCHVGGRWYVDLDAVAELFPSRRQVAS